MGERWTAPGGWRIEAIVSGDQPQYRVTHHGVIIGYPATITQLEVLLKRHEVDFADLAEDEPA